MAKLERVNLTVGRIKAFICSDGKSQAFLWDSEVPGLAVRATPPSKRTPVGNRSFVFQGYLNGATPRLTIGDTRIWTLEKARIEARRLQTLLDQGIDPREHRREQEESAARIKEEKDAARKDAEIRKRYTLRTLCEAYSDLLDTKGKAQSARQTRSIFKCHLFDANPTLAATPAREITPHHIASLVRHVIEQDKSRTAGILRSYLCAAFNAARKAPFDAKLPASFIAYGVEMNPVDPVSTIAVARGNRTLNPTELKDYLGSLGDDLTDRALKLALYSGGQRMAQLLRAKISDYDERTRSLRLWDGKGKRTTPREHLLPLAPMSAELVEKLIKRAGSLGTQLLFSSFGKTQLAETTPGKRAAAICKKMGCEQFDLRDIRRTCETMLAGMGISRDTRSQLLSHGLSGVQAAHYDRHTYIDEKRAALVAWEKNLDDVVAGKKPKNVYPLKRKRS